MITKKSAITFAIILLIASSFPWAFSLAKAQTVTEFTTADVFAIQEENGAIKFFLNGTYESATLENGSWVFVNLRLNYTGGGVNITISVMNCTITITNCRVFNTTLPSASLRYFVSGVGFQSVRFNHDLTRAEWLPTYSYQNRSHYLIEHRDWEDKPDGTIIVTGAPANSSVSLSYRVFADYLGGNEDTSNQSFLQQHSVAIAAGIAAVAAVTFALAVREVTLRKQEREVESDVSPQMR